MYWKEYSRKALVLAILFGVFFSCRSNNAPEKKTASSTQTSELTLKKQIKRMVESELSINAQENYSMQIIFKNLNADTLKDAVVLVNRKEFAYQHFKEKDHSKFFDKMGHTASFNYVFVKLGGMDQLISANPMAVGSNVDYKLNASFLHLISPTQLDICVTYRIRNSLHKNYYTLRNHRLYLVFSYPVFDKIGDKNPQVYQAIPEISPVREAKDIALYKGKILNYNLGKIEDLYNYQPDSIVATDSLVGYFILDENKMKYVTPMPPVQD